MNDISVLYIAGAGRSGTTLLDRILGTLGAFSSAELNRVWEHGVVLDHGCGCGVPFSECSFWREVTSLSMGEDPRKTATRAVELQSSVARSRDFFRLYTGVASPAYRARVAEYRELLRRFYGAVAEASGERVIVDSSKIPTEALVLAGVPGLDVRVVHLVRDPRACVYSWRRHRIDPGHGGTQGKQSTLRTVRFWNTRNTLAGMLSHRLPYVRVTYEALTSDPDATLRAICSAVGGVDPDALRLHGDRAIELPTTHAVSGNPSRYRTGVVELRTDSEWQESMDPATARTVTLLTAPLLRRYGYPFDWRQPMVHRTADVAAG